jgi:hypothetical protein
MKKLLVLMVLLFSLNMSQLFGQVSRQPQKEIFGGIAIPTGPEGFKDYFKVGFSPHIQYVMFLSPRLGISVGGAYEYFTFDGEKFLQDLSLATGIDFSGASIDGNYNNIELSVGIRPYLTAPEAATQLFVFGMGTYNFMKMKITVRDNVTGQESSDTGDDNKAGIGFGGGIEMPAGESFNIIIQGIFRIIFTDEESTKFLGITAGLIF